jgi:tetratricopeptide (TPR) repeat protein
MNNMNTMQKEIDTLLNLAYIYMNYGKTKRAIDYLLIAYRIDPQNIQVKKMKVVAFRDIGAFSQALEIIKELEIRQDLETDDKITLKLMKSFCLKGMDKLEEGRKVFDDYIKDRKESASKTFMKNHRKKLLQSSSFKN